MFGIIQTVINEKCQLGNNSQLMPDLFAKFHADVFYMMLQVFDELIAMTIGRKNTEIYFGETQIGTYTYYRNSHHFTLRNFASRMHEYITQILLDLARYFLLSCGFHKAIE